MSIYPGAIVGNIEVDGATVGYVDSMRSRDDVPPLVLLHGSGGTAQNHFGTIFPMFASRRRVIAIDYGDVNAAPDVSLTLESLGERVRRLIDERVPEVPVDVLGYSLGAAVAMQYAATHGSRLRTLAIAGGWLRTDAHQRLRNTLWHRLHEAGDESLAMFSVLSAYGSPYLAKRTPSEITEMIGRSKPGPDRLRQMQLNAALDVTGLASDVEVPTLIIAGQYDQMAPIKHSRELLGAIPDARLAVVRSGHAMFTERPAEIFQIIDEFALDPSFYPSGATLPRLVI